MAVRGPSLSVRIREFKDSDYDSLAEILNAIYPDHRTDVEDLREDDKRFDKERYVRKRYVAVDDTSDQVIAFGVYSHIPGMFDPQRFRVDIFVHPFWWRRGVGTRLWHRILEDLRDLKATVVLAVARESLPNGLEFLRKLESLAS